MNVPAVTLPDPAIVESVLIKGDLAALTVQQRLDYLLKVCETVGLNPLTQPFEYVNFQGRLQLYAKKNCAEQLRMIYNISVEDVTSKTESDIYIVTTKVKLANGRTDVATGAVAIGNLRGEARANAIMKSETKSKRRATLSICGLGFLLDESELPDEVFQRLPQAPAPNVILPPPIPMPPAAADAPRALIPPAGSEPAPPSSDATPTRTTDGAGDGEESQRVLAHDEALAEAAKKGTKALEQAFKAMPESYQTVLRAALERRHWPTAKQADAQ